MIIQLWTHYLVKYVYADNI